MSDLSNVSILVLSPHPSDAVLSCGGLLLQNQDSQVVTIFNGDSPKPRQGELAKLISQEERRQEDALAMDALCVRWQGLNFPDAMDRRDTEGALCYSSLNDFFGPIAPSDTALCFQIEEEVEKRLIGRVLVCPLAIGAHVDHQLCAHVGRRLAAKGHKVWFYEDAPYVFPDAGDKVQSGDSVMHAARRMRANIRGNWDLEIDLAKKSAILASYRSQMKALFGSLHVYQLLAEAHFESLGNQVERFYLLRW